MNQSLVTVIMALYNAEPYLRRCLDSLQAQTLDDFNVIIVDDGSKDISLEIALDYSLRDKRFHVYHKENGGVSSARQYGIELLEKIGGKYSIHVDPDDWVEPQMLERMCKKAEGTGADMVICDYYQNISYKQRIRRQNPKSEDPRKVLGALFRGLHGSLCNKLIRTDCYKVAGIRFPEGLNYCEDFYVNVCLLQKIRKVAYLPEAFYHYDCFSNDYSETRKGDRLYVNYIYTEIVRRCRGVVPDGLKDWQFYCFELRNAYYIMIRGCMADTEFKSFFRKKYIGLLFHPSSYSIPQFLTILAVYTGINHHYIAKVANGYLQFRHQIVLLLRQ